MRFILFAVVGYVLVLVQGVLFRLLDPVTDALSRLGGSALSPHGFTPDLALPLVVYVGIHDRSMTRGALTAYFIGWSVDVLGGGPAYLFRLTMGRSLVDCSRDQRARFSTGRIFQNSVGSGSLFGSKRHRSGASCDFRQ